MASRRFTIGAEMLPDGQTHFRVWAPKCVQVELIIEAPHKRVVELQRESDGYFSGLARAPAGTQYRFRRDGDAQLYPDPASRFQPDGPHGPSQVVDPYEFRWTDQDWKGVSREGMVLYEMHVGTFTAEGTWEAAERALPALADLGITVVEVMPVADFPGEFGWGYDGVNLFAPTRLYGTPDDFRRFVDTAHRLNLGVILDVVYNHFGPDGNYLRAFSEDYFSAAYKNEWGDAINFDGPNAGPVRDFFCANAAYWIDEFHLDGLRLDATQQIFDASPTHILTDIGKHVRRAAKGRGTYVVAENEAQEARLVRAMEAGGMGLDALWNDDFHHAAHVALTGRSEAYYTDYAGTPQEFISAAKWGYLYQGQRYAWQKQRRGAAALDLEPSHMVSFLENHDQLANSANGRRLRLMSSPGRYRAMTALWLLSPATPMFFQGQEFGTVTPFHYFADHNPELAKLVSAGRRQFMTQFASMQEFDMLNQMPEPAARETFTSCKLMDKERDIYPEFIALHRDLLRLRREDPAFRSTRRGAMDGAVLGPEALVFRFFAANSADRLLVVNLGREIELPIVPEPLLSPPDGARWSLLWSSSDPAYGGVGHAAVENDIGIWRLPGETAVVLMPKALSADNY